MKTSFFVVLSFFFLSGQATPLGDRDVLRRYNGVALSRRHLLQSRMDAPPACAAISPALSPTASSTPTDTTLSSNPTASRRHLTGFSFSTEENISSSFFESVTTMVSSWESLCASSGLECSSYESCLDLGGFNTIEALLETANPCDQQVIADNMITFAKSDGIRNRGDLINFALGYRKHARHAVRIFGVIPSSLFCLRAPTNTELVGVYNEQTEGCNPGIFGSSASALVPFGSDGTCPYGMSADVSTCGCSDGDDSTTSTTDDNTSSDDSSGTTDSTDNSDDNSDDSSDSSDSTDASDGSDDTSTASDGSTDADPTTGGTSSSAATVTATANAVPAAPFVTPTDTSGPNVQPTDISGNVNDPEGR